MKYQKMMKIKSKKNKKNLSSNFVIYYAAGIPN